MTGQLGEQTPGERLVEERVRAALAGTTPGADVYANVHWLVPTRPGGPPRDGETDLLVVHPEFGLLAIEVKDGTVAREASGHWFAGNRPLPESPFHQAMVGAHAIGDLIAADPRWGGRPGPRMLHAVAFPDTDRESLGANTLGPDAPIELVIDRADLTDETTTTTALDRIFRFWSGDGARDRPLSEPDRATIREILEPTIRLRSLLRGDIEAGERALLTPTQHQLDVLRILRRERRASIEGGAGSGKTLVAIEKARQLASEGYKTLFVCFNQPLARAVADEPDLAPFIGAGMLTVTTFHELCLRLGTEAHTLPPKPEPPDQAWWDVALPHALADATKTVGGRWHALVIDEGQDFAADWLVTLQLLLDDPEHDVLYVFHDPAQALYRPDVSGDLGLHEYPLDLNCRNPGAIHAFAYRWYTGDLHSEPMREEGRAPVVIEAAAGEATVQAVGQVLRDIVHTEKVPKDQVAVLLGGSLRTSAIWHHGRFKGGIDLWNANAATGTGESLGLAFDKVPAQPRGTILCDSIRRFKGLDREVIILAELDPDDERLGQLLYVGASRAREHLVVIVPPELARRLTT